MNAQLLQKGDMQRDRLGCLQPGTCTFWAQGLPHPTAVNYWSSYSHINGNSRRLPQCTFKFGKMPVRVLEHACQPIPTSPFISSQRPGCLLPTLAPMLALLCQALCDIVGNAMLRAALPRAGAGHGAQYAGGIRVRGRRESMQLPVKLQGLSAEGLTDI